jgi:hypothetical protein
MEDAGGMAKEHRRSTDGIGGGTERSLDRIQGNTTDYE